MTKTISLELSKRLAPYLEDSDTEYYINEQGDIIKWYCLGEDEASGFFGNKVFETLTLEDAIKFMENLPNKARDYVNEEISRHQWDMLSVTEIVDIDFTERVFTYLLDNNLLNK